MFEHFVFGCKVFHVASNIVSCNIVSSKIVGYMANFDFSSSETTKILLKQSLKKEVFSKEKGFWHDFWSSRRFWKFPTTHTPTSLQLFTLSHLCVRFSYHLSLSSYYVVQYPHMLKKDELLDRHRKVIRSHCFDHCFAVITISVHIKTVDFLLFSGCEKTLRSAVWSCFLVDRHELTLKKSEIDMSGCQLQHVGVKLPTRVQSCCHILTHWEGV